MAVQKNGLTIGRVGDTVTYLLNGELVTRRIGITDKKPTKPQLTFRQKTRVLNAFLRKITEFINVGFERDGLRLRKSAYALAFGYNLVHAFKGTYPKVAIEFKNVKLATGDMPEVSDVVVEVVSEGLKFSWNPESKDFGTHWTDQVMLMAYFPKLKKAMYITGGVNRNIGSCVLPFYQTSHGYIAETYIAFISNDRRSISNSIYTGQWFW